MYLRKIDTTVEIDLKKRKRKEFHIDLLYLCAQPALFLLSFLTFLNTIPKDSRIGPSDDVNFVKDSSRNGVKFLSSITLVGVICF